VGEFTALVCTGVTAWIPSESSSGSKAYATKEPGRVLAPTASRAKNLAGVVPTIDKNGNDEP